MLRPSWVVGFTGKSEPTFVTEQGAVVGERRENRLPSHTLRLVEFWMNWARALRFIAIFRREKWNP
jgi:hypothetical protein